MGCNESCIIHNFDRFITLTEDEKALLSHLEKEPTHIKKKERVWEAGTLSDQLYTLKSGWAYSYNHSGNGDVKVLEIFLPGDIIGLREFTYKYRLSGVRMLTGGVLCPFPIQCVLDIFDRSQTLTAVLFAASSRQQALLTERMLNLMQCSARTKVAHFIVEIYMRLKRINPSVGHTFAFPISQQMIGELLGISTVHVSRTLTDIEQDGLLKKHRRTVEIFDMERLIDEAEFKTDYMNDDLGRLLKRN
ncbi:Crp/Fnr family transcriptional regulator [Phytohalomonas tamaricis]|uniref:Crp/Fnr family transcriptional regulator n=1 Tax=Phytohalomonas tamaricis TaxID=2081032 RepID=UPI000D0BC089|nr:Crp/Fnr family transcriptional regulator [Phytohalomonas tamaricis]